MTKRERCAAPEVFGALAGFMHGEPVFKVIGDARVKRIVSAAQDVDSPGHGNDSNKHGLAGEGLSRHGLEPDGFLLFQFAGDLLVLGLRVGGALAAGVESGIRH